MSLIQKIKDYYKNEKSILFTTPSHNQGAFIPGEAKRLLGDKFYKSDFSEIEGFDNLRNPQEVLKDLLGYISSVYGSKQSFILTNGSTSGIITAMLSVLKNKDEVLIARNCHVSVYNGLVLTGAKPVWFMPKFNEEWDIYEGVKAKDVEPVLKANPKIKALIITSPTYEGVFSDIREIAMVTKEYGVKLIVDEAHGALLNFGKLGSLPAILCGADLSVQSLHKTAGAPNPCALLHIGPKSDIEPEVIQQALNLTNTTSPSYPLMAATEATVRFLDSEKGRESVLKLIKKINSFNFPSNVKRYSGFNDPTKILIKIGGISGMRASFFLNSEFNIEEEFSNDKSMLFITGIGTTDRKLSKLYRAIKKLSKVLIPKNDCTTVEIKNYALPQIAISPRKAYFHKNKRKVKKFDALNKISAEIIITYPPGIPTLLPGEIINNDVLKYIQKNEILVCD